MARRNNRFQPDQESNFVLSYELLFLLRWFVKNDPERFRKMVQKAYSAGLRQELEKIDRFAGDASFEEMQTSIIDFFDMLSQALAETIRHQVTMKAQQKNLMSSVDQIDLQECDTWIVQSSLEKATHKLELNPAANPKELLFEELLKRWKPHGKAVVN